MINAHSKLATRMLVFHIIVPKQRANRMIDVRGHFSQVLSEGKRLVLMPVSRFAIEKPFHIDPFAFYPAGSIELAALRTVPGHSLDASRNNTNVSVVSGGPPARSEMRSRYPPTPKRRDPICDACIPRGPTREADLSSVGSRRIAGRKVGRGAVVRSRRSPAGQRDLPPTG